MDGCSGIPDLEMLVSALAKNGMIIVMYFFFYNIWGNIPWKVCNCHCDSALCAQLRQLSTVGGGSDG